MDRRVLSLRRGGLANATMTITVSISPHGIVLFARLNENIADIPPTV